MLLNKRNCGIKVQVRSCVFMCFCVYIHSQKGGKEDYDSTEYIQGDSGGKVNIFRGDSIGRCEKESSYERVSNSEW
jgi:hypothetical protein